MNKHEIEAIQMCIEDATDALKGADEKSLGAGHGLLTAKMIFIKSRLESIVRVDELNGDNHEQR